MQQLRVFLSQSKSTKQDSTCFGTLKNVPTFLCIFSTITEQKSVKIISINACSVSAGGWSQRSAVRPGHRERSHYAPQQA